MAKTHLDLVLSSISIVVVVICLILLSCLRCSVSLILRSVTNVPINSKLQYLPWATHWHLTVVRARGGNLNLARLRWGIWTARAFAQVWLRRRGGGLNAPIFKSSNAWGDTEASIWSMNNTVVGLSDWRLTGWLSNRQTDCPDWRLTGWMTRLSDWLTHWLTDRLVVARLADWLTDRPTDRLAGWPSD